MEKPFQRRIIRRLMLFELLFEDECYWKREGALEWKWVMRTRDFWATEGVWETEAGVSKGKPHLLDHFSSVFPAICIPFHHYIG